MKAKPNKRVMKEFVSQCETLEFNVVASMLFYYMVDEDASYKTRLVTYLV